MDPLNLFYIFPVIIYCLVVGFLIYKNNNIAIYLVGFALVYFLIFIFNNMIYLYSYLFLNNLASEVKQSIIFHLTLTITFVLLFFYLVMKKIKQDE